MGRRKKDATGAAWSIDTEYCGTITSLDVPRLMSELLKVEFPSKINLALSTQTAQLKAYATGKMEMSLIVGKRFVYLLDLRAKKKKEAVPAATETTQRSEETQHETSPDIVPQSQEETKDMSDEVIKKRGRPPKFRLDEPANQVTDQVTGQVTDQVAEAGKMIDVSQPATEAEALRAVLRSAEEALEKEQKESAARLIKLEEAQAGLEEKTLEAADLRAKLKTRTDETVDLRAQINELNSALDTATAKLASVQGREMEELERENDMLRRRIAQFEVDDASCGPARVEQLETQVEKAQRQHVEDLELIRDMCRNLLDWRGDE